MLVTNARGQVCHITAALAERLGRTRQQALGGGINTAVEQLMAEPFAQMHRSLLAVR